VKGFYFPANGIPAEFFSSVIQRIYRQIGDEFPFDPSPFISDLLLQRMGNCQYLAGYFFVY